MTDITSELPPRTDTWLFLAALRVALRRVSAWGTMTLALAFLSLPIALPWRSWFAGATGNRYAPGSLVHHLNETFRFDHRADLARLDATGADALAVLVLAAFLLGVFAAGGWLQVTLERTHGQTVRRFFYGGVRYYWRFLRLALLVFLVLGGLRWCFYGMPWDEFVLKSWMGVPDHDLTGLETLDSELTVLRLGWLQAGLMALFVALTLAWATFTRTRLALHGTSSVLWAGGCSFFVMLRRPLKTLRPMLLLLTTEALIVVGLCGWLTRRIDAGLEHDPSALRVVGLFVLGLVALAWREILRGAKYQAAVQVSQEVIRPTLHPDPWHTIGGPGGPQYPVDGDDDDYGVAL
jgi:hypothetical protein